MTIGAFAVVTIVARSSRRRPPHARPSTAGWRPSARRWPVCSRSSCSRRPACRSPAGSSPSSRCSRPPSTPASTTWPSIGMIAAVVAAFFYLRVVVTDVLAGGDEPAESRRARAATAAGRRRPAAVALTVTAALTSGARHPPRRVPRLRPGRHVHCCELIDADAQRRRRNQRRRWHARRGAAPRSTSCSSSARGGEVVGLVDELMRAGEVEQVPRSSTGAAARPRRPRAATCRSSRSNRWLAGDRERPHRDVERGAQRPVDEGARHVAARRSGRSGPARACHSGTVFDDARRRRAGARRARWAGRAPGAPCWRAAPARAGPDANTTSSPVSRSVATTRSGTSSSSNGRGGVGPVDDGVAGPRCRTGGRRGAGGSRPGASLPPGNTSPARSDVQTVVEVLDAREVRVGRDDRAVQRPGRGADRRRRARCRARAAPAACRPG